MYFLDYNRHASIECLLIVTCYSLSATVALMITVVPFFMLMYQQIYDIEELFMYRCVLYTFFSRRTFWNLTMFLFHTCLDYWGSAIQSFFRITFATYQQIILAYLRDFFAVFSMNVWPSCRSSRPPECQASGKVPREGLPRAEDVYRAEFPR